MDFEYDVTSQNFQTLRAIVAVFLFIILVATLSYRPQKTKET